MTATIQPFRNRSFVLFLLAAFVLLCMPTVSIGDNFLTSQSSSLSHDVPNSVKVTKRASASLTSKALLTALLLLVLLFSLHAYSTYIVPASKTVSLPVHLPGLRKLLLMPLKFTSTYVRM